MAPVTRSAKKQSVSADAPAFPEFHGKWTDKASPAIAAARDVS